MRNKEKNGPNTHRKINNKKRNNKPHLLSLVRDNQGQYYMHIDLFKKERKESQLLNQLVFLKCFHSMSSASLAW